VGALPTFFLSRQDQIRGTFLQQMETRNLAYPELWDALEAYLAAERIELDDLELVGRGRAQTLRILIDGDKLDLDRISEVSRGVSRLLDSFEGRTPDGPYQLEVSSPGLERKLNRPRHYQKSIGREAVIRTGDGQRRGVIEAADDDGFTLTEGETKTALSFSEVLSARTVFTLEKPPKPGQKSN